MTESTSLPTPPRRVRPAGERFHSQRSWLDSSHSFSFADHHHPDWMGFGPLRVINDDIIAAGKGFGMHAHRSPRIHCDGVELAGSADTDTLVFFAMHFPRNGTRRSGCRWRVPTRA